MKVPNAKKVGGKDDKVATRASNFHNSPDPAGFELNGGKSYQSDIRRSW